MAVLSLPGLRKHGYTSTFVEKMYNGATKPSPDAMFQAMDGKKYFLDKMSYKPSGGTTQIYSILQKRQEILDLLTGNSSLPMLKFTSRDGKTFALSDLMKTEELGGKSNKGDMAEIIFSAAITARFLNRTQPIAKSDVEALLRQISDTSAQQKLPASGFWQVETAQKGIYDKVNWSFSSPLITVQTLAKESNRVKNKDIIEMIEASVRYANSGVVTANAVTFHTNYQSNKIEVKAIGTIAQSSTKVDVTVIVDGKPTDINVSLKTKNAKQFGQVGGGGYEKQQELWKGLTGITVPKTAINAYIDTIQNGGVIKAVGKIYYQMTVLLNQKLDDLNDDVYDNLAKGIIFHATRNMEGVSMVKLTPKETQVFKFDDFTTALQLTKAKLQAVYVSNGQFPQVNIIETAGRKVVLTVRFKKESGVGEAEYYRNYIETGPGMKAIANILT